MPHPKDNWANVVAQYLGRTAGVCFKDKQTIDLGLRGPLARGHMHVVADEAR